jgi:hypothetical protein
MALRSYLKDGTATLTAGQSLLTAWTGTPSTILSAKNSTDNVIIQPVPQGLKHVFDTAMYSNYFAPSATNQYYSIENGYFTLLDGTGTSVDSIYLRYVKEHSNLSAGATASTILYDASFTYTVATLTISLFGSSIATSHVGGRVTGTDAGGNYFDRLITGYVGTGSFTIDSALTNAGTACTAGYVIPPSQNDIEIDSQYWDEVLQEAYKTYLKRVPTENNLRSLQVA